jgi:FkbH-like protein
LTNKTNQFNLTTRRYTLAEIEAISKDKNYIGLYGKLSDRFGDNGLISIVLGRKEAATLHLDLWLMSCRVLKRDMEVAMLDAMVERAARAGIDTLVGYYLPTRKNEMVADHYEKLGFIRLNSSPADAPVFTLSVPSYSPRNTHIKVLELIYGSSS